MTDKSGQLKEAIEVLKDAEYIGSAEYISEYDKRINEAIDTVVSELEKPTYTSDDMIDFAIWVKEGIYKNKVGIRFNGEFVKYIEGIPVPLKNEQVIKLWEEQK